MKIYTCTGDDGTTSLPGGKRVKKHDIRIEALGSVDELIAWIGLLRDYKENLKRKDILMYIQDQLMRCSAALSSADGSISAEFLPSEESISRLEHEIDLMQDKLKPLQNFILPGGHILVSCCHIARTVCRRAERTIMQLNEKDPVPGITIKFMNRLSDFLFVLARMIGKELEAQEIKWPL
jgi:cob(I)alamin adenosyltransferase